MRYHPRIYVVHISPHVWTDPIKQIMFSGPRGPLVLPLIGPFARPQQFFLHILLLLFLLFLLLLLSLPIHLIHLVHPIHLSHPIHLVHLIYLFHLINLFHLTQLTHLIHLFHVFHLVHLTIPFPPSLPSALSSLSPPSSPSPLSPLSGSRFNLVDLSKTIGSCFPCGSRWRGFPKRILVTCIKYLLFILVFIFHWNKELAVALCFAACF